MSSPAMADRHNRKPKKFTMKEFVLIFRTSSNPHGNIPPEIMQERMSWINSIVTQNKLADKGNRFSFTQAKTVKPGNEVAEGPYGKESISGYMIVKAADIDEAIDMAKGNPIFKMGGNIEVRAILGPDEKA